MNQFAGVIINVVGSPVRAAGNRPGVFLTLIAGFLGLALLAGVAAVVLPLLVAATAFLAALTAVLWPVALLAVAGAVGVGLPLAAHQGVKMAQLNHDTMNRHELLMALTTARRGREAAIEPAPVFVASARTREVEAVRR